MAFAQLSLNSINTDLHTNYSTTTIMQAWVASQGYLTSANLTAYRLVADSYSTSETDLLLNAKLDVTAAASTYATITALNLKANSTDVYTTAQVDLLLNAKLDASAITNYYTKTEADALLADKADTATVALKIERTDYFTATLGGTVKAPGGTPTGANVLCDDGNFRSVASVGGGVTNAVDLNTTASAITESLNQQGYNDSVETLVRSQRIYGFENQSAGIISYDPSTLTFTITGEHIVYINGKRTVKTTASITHPAVTATHYFYYDSTGTLTTAYSSAWGGQFLNCAQIAYAYYNATKVTTPKGILFDERHGHIMSTATHANLHLTRGATSPYLFPISAYSLQPASPTNAGNQFAIQGGVLYDEDLSTTIPDFQDGVAPAIFWREGANGDYTWNPSPVVPAITGTTYIKYNQFVTGSWTTTEVSSDNYVNIYTAVTNSTDATYENILFVGQQVYTSLATAQAESPLTGYSFGTGVPFNEIIVTNKITLRARSTYTSATGRFRIEAVESLAGINVRLGSAVSANTIPTAGQISYVDANSLGATNVQTAIDTIAVNFPSTTAMNTAIANATASVSVNQTVNVTAGENLTAGDVVSLINSGGTVTAKKNNLAVNTSPNGAESVFLSATTTHCSATALDTTRFIVCYQKTAGYAYARVGTVSGSSIAWGTESSAFENATSAYITSCKVDTDKVIALYNESDNSKLRMIVLTISGDSISNGTPVDFTTNRNSVSNSVTLLEANKVLVCAKKGGTTEGHSKIVTISATVPTPYPDAATDGTVFNAAATAYISCSALSATSAIVAYQDGGNSNYGTAQVLSISDTTITPGTEYVFNSAGTDRISVITHTTNKAIISFRNTTTAYVGKSIIATNTAGALGYGTPYSFITGGGASIDAVSSAYMGNGYFLLSYVEGAASDGYSQLGKVNSDDSISFETYKKINTYTGASNSICYLGNQKSAICYSDAGNSSYGTAVVNTWATSDYSAIRGLCSQTTSSGNSAPILLHGTLSAYSNLISGADYFVQSDYSIGTLPVSLNGNYIKIGEAVSSTTLFCH